jgi:hypothetical protein
VRSRASAIVLAAWSSGLLLGPLGCGGGSGPPEAASRAGEPPEARLEPVSALPADLPERLEIEYRRRMEDGDDRVLKLTPAGARHGLAHGKARVAVRYRLPEDALPSVYATLRQEGFDRMETVPRQGTALMGGTSVRVSTGTETYVVNAMGLQGPRPEDAEAHARCIAGLEALLPTGRSDVVVELRWDASVHEMRDHNASLDVDAGEDLVGLHRRSPASGAETAAEPVTLELHLARARPLELQLRQSGPRGAAPRSTTLVVAAGEERGVELSFDATLGEVVARTLR